MPIEQRLFKGNGTDEPDWWGPVVICDACRRIIKGSGHVHWYIDEYGYTHGPLFSHKNDDCPDAIWKRRKYRQNWLTSELDAWLSALARHVAIDRAE